MPNDPTFNILAEQFQKELRENVKLVVECCGDFLKEFAETGDEPALNAIDWIKRNYLDAPTDSDC